MEYTRKIVLENGIELYGMGFGSNKTSVNELVFNTSMAGYQEIVSNLSYIDKLIVMSYPLIGNYGMTDDDFESKIPKAGGLIVREYNDSPSNFRYTKTLSEILEENDIPAISGIDTRMLIRIIRNEGNLKAMITDAKSPIEDTLSLIREYKMPKDAVTRASCKKRWYSRTANPRFNVVAIDCGIKLSIVRLLNRYGCNVTIVPYDTTAKEVLLLKPDGILISNGPGDPKDVTILKDQIKELRGKMPIFGINLGCLLIALAYGADTEKQKSGHYGGNHPVRNILTQKIEITSQGHSYSINDKSLEGTGLEITHINILDNTVEGIECKKDMVLGVQFHPESNPGPQDSMYLFDKFIDLLEYHQKTREEDNIVCQNEMI